MAFYTIHPKEISTVLYQKKAIIVDIREPEEYRKFHYKKAVNVPYTEDETWIRYFNKKRVFILYCDYGSTSLLAARRMSKEGFEVYTIIGGVKAMKEHFYD